MYGSYRRIQQDSEVLVTKEEFKLKSKLTYGQQFHKKQYKIQRPLEWEGITMGSFNPESERIGTEEIEVVGALLSFLQRQ